MLRFRSYLQSYKLRNIFALELRNILQMCVYHLHSSTKHTKAPLYHTTLYLGLFLMKFLFEKEGEGTELPQESS